MAEVFNLANTVNETARNAVFGTGAYPTAPSATFDQITAVGDPLSWQLASAAALLAGQSGLARSGLDKIIDGPGEYPAILSAFRFLESCRCFDAVRCRNHVSSPHRSHALHWATRAAPPRHGYDRGAQWNPRRCPNSGRAG